MDERREEFAEIIAKEAAKPIRAAREKWIVLFKHTNLQLKKRSVYMVRHCH